MWNQPIYDRTINDVRNKTTKGYLNYTDMNRIEGNIGYIAELMGISLTTKTWTTLTIPTSADFDRIKSNIETLESHIDFTTYNALPDDPINTYDKVNKIEMMVETIKGDFDIVMGASMYTGENGYAGSILI